MTHNKGHADLLPFLERIRALTEQYDARFTVAEIGGEDAEPSMKLYTAGDRRLHTAYGFNFLYRRGLDAGAGARGAGSLAR